MASQESIPGFRLGKGVLPAPLGRYQSKFGQIGTKNVLKDIDKLDCVCLYLKSKEVDQMAQAYCFKCRTKREIRNPVKMTLKNGRPAIRGTCPSCGTKVFRIGG